MHYRTERDSFGEVTIPVDKHWGIHTQRSYDNFPIGTEKIPKEIIKAYATIKYAAAKANEQLDVLETEKREAIEYATNLIAQDKLTEHFPLVVWQTGSGTQTNMNVNEVIASVGNDWLEENGYEARLHPNDDVNQSQSSNDTFPTAMYVAFVCKISNGLLPALDDMKDELTKKRHEFEQVVKIGRTHLQDATPLTVGQEISAWEKMIERSRGMVIQSLKSLTELGIGGTAVGTGLNAYQGYSKIVCEIISRETGYLFQEAENKFHSLTSYDEVVFVHGSLKALATDLMKIANDIRLLSSGPRSGIGEYLLQANEAGSSIMPGKVNPTQCEALTMVCAQVMGNDTTIGIAASQGQLQLNTFKPVIALNFLQSCTLIEGAVRSFTKRCIKGLAIDQAKIERYVEQSLMLVTALNRHVGYEIATKISQYAHEKNIELRDAATQLGYMTEEQYNKYVQPSEMTRMFGENT